MNFYFFKMDTNKEYLLNRTLEELRKKYTMGLYEFMFTNKSVLFTKLENLEQEIDRLILNGTKSDLKKILREYWELHVEASNEFQKKRSGFNFQNARKEYMKKRLNS